MSSSDRGGTIVGHAPRDRPLLVVNTGEGKGKSTAAFGMVLRASKSNEARSRALGFSPYPYRLAAFVIAGAMCGVAGALYAHHTNYLTPGFMSWQQSGELMFMVILGGMASSSGPVLGTFALLLVEEVLKGWTEYWQVILGPLLVLSVIFFKRGLAGIFYKPDA